MDSNFNVNSAFFGGNHMFLESCGSYSTNFSGAHFQTDCTNNSLVEEYSLGPFLCYLLGNE